MSDFVRVLAIASATAIFDTLVVLWARFRFRLRRTVVLALFGLIVVLVGVPLLVSRVAATGGAWMETFDASVSLLHLFVAIAFGGIVLLEVALWLRARRRTTDVPASSTPVVVLDRREALAKIGAGTIALGSSLPILWGTFKTRVDFEIVEVPIRLARLPRALDGFTLVQLSDVHVGPFLGEHPLRLAEEAIARLRPDLVAMTGDLIEVQRIWVPSAVAWLRRVSNHARFGGVAIAGNHEHYAGADLVLGAIRSAGVDALYNEGRVIAPNDGGGFALVGVDDLSSERHRRGPGPRPAAALSRLPPDLARILLCHQPSYVSRAQIFGFDLMLSGHTHGGQIAPFGPLVLAQAYPSLAGLSQHDDLRLYVNRGFGTSGPPTRIAIRPEITKFVLVAG